MKALIRVHANIDPASKAFLYVLTLPRFPDCGSSSNEMWYWKNYSGSKPVFVRLPYGYVFPPSEPFNPSVHL
jgi:hypothetical protein